MLGFALRVAPSFESYKPLTVENPESTCRSKPNSSALILGESVHVTQLLRMREGSEISAVKLQQAVRRRQPDCAARINQKLPRLTNIERWSRFVAILGDSTHTLRGCYPHRSVAVFSNRANVLAGKLF